MSVWYCWWGRRKHLLTPSTETAAEAPRATRADSAAVCEAVAVKWANASNLPRAQAAESVAGGPRLAYIPAGEAAATRRSSRYAAAASRSRRSPGIRPSAARRWYASRSSARSTCSRSACAACSTTPRRRCRVLVADDASDDPAAARLVEEVNAAHPGAPAGRLLRQPENVGFVRNVNAALRLLAPADVIVLNSDCVVAGGWYEGMRRAAYSDTRVATASTLTNHGTIVSVPSATGRSPTCRRTGRSTRRPPRCARSARGCTPRCPPRSATASTCVAAPSTWSGDLDEAFAPGYEEEVDFSQRCMRHGLSHVLADDVFVLHHGGGSFDATRAAATLREEHHRMVRRAIRTGTAGSAEVEERHRHAAGALAVRRPAGAARRRGDDRRAHPHRVHDRHAAARAGGDRRVSTTLEPCRSA